MASWLSYVPRCLEAFSPKADATKTEIRRIGAAAAFVGAAVLAVGVVVFVVVRSMLADGVQPPRVVGLPLFGGYVLMMTGLYRLLTGQRPGEEHKGVLASLGRIALALAITLSLVVFVMVGAVLLRR